MQLIRANFIDSKITEFTRYFAFFQHFVIRFCTDQVNFSIGGSIQVFSLAFSSWYKRKANANSIATDTRVNTNLSHWIRFDLFFLVKISARSKGIFNVAARRTIQMTEWRRETKSKLKSRALQEMFYFLFFSVDKKSQTNENVLHCQEQMKKSSASPFIGLHCRSSECSGLTIDNSQKEFDKMKRCLCHRINRRIIHCIIFEYFVVFALNFLLFFCCVGEKETDSDEKLSNVVTVHQQNEWIFSASAIR